MGVRWFESNSAHYFFEVYMPASPPLVRVIHTTEIVGTCDAIAAQLNSSLAPGTYHYGRGNIVLVVTNSEPVEVPDVQDK